MKQLLLQAPLVDHAPETLLRAYATIKLVKKKQEVKGIQRPLMAFKWNEAEICKAAEGNAFNAVEGWSGKEQYDFIEAYEQIVEMDIKTFLLQYLPDYITQMSRMFYLLKRASSYSEADAALAIICAKKHFFDAALRDEPYPEYVKRIFPTEKQQNDFYYAVNTFYLGTMPPHRYLGTSAVLCLQKSGIKEPELMLNTFLMARGEKSDFSGAKIDAMRLLNAQVSLKEAETYIKDMEFPAEFLLDVYGDGDCAMETGCLFTRFVDYQVFDENARILIINPSVGFLSKCTQWQHLSRTTFAMASEAERSILAMQFQTANIITIEQMKRDPAKYTRILFFSRTLEKEEIERIFAEMGSSCLPATIVQAVIPSALATIIKGLYRIDLFPEGAFNAHPKKKVLTYADFRENPQILLTNYRWYDKGRLYIDKSVKVSLAELTNARSVKLLFKTASGASKANKRKGAERFFFTPDIEFRTVVHTRPGDNPIYQVYACQIPTEKQCSRGSKGKKLIGIETSTAREATREGMEYWRSEVVPFIDHIQSGIREYLLNAPISADDLAFKTLWYIQHEGCREETLMDLVNSPVGRCCLSHPNTFLAELDAYCVDKSPTQRDWVWTTVKSVCTTCKELGFALDDAFLRQRHKTIKKQDAHMAAVKNNLATMGFSYIEERKLVEFLYEKLVNEKEYLAVLIRFYTSLSPDIIAALRWSDFEPLPGENGYRIRLCRRCKNGQTIPFEDAEEYRYIPVAPELSKELCKDIPKNKESLMCGEITVNRVKTLSRIALEALGRKEQVFDLPTEDGIKTVDFSNVARDPFAEHFKKRLITCGFTEGEIRFLCLRQQRSVYSRNYADYSNPLSTIKLGRKLSRWIVLEQSNDKNQVRRGSFGENKSFYTPGLPRKLPRDPSNNDGAMQIRLQTIQLEMLIKAGATIRVQSKKGIDVHAGFIEEDPYEEDE